MEISEKVFFRRMWANNMLYILEDFSDVSDKTFYKRIEDKFMEIAREYLDLKIEEIQNFDNMEKVHIKLQKELLKIRIDYEDYILNDDSIGYSHISFEEDIDNMVYSIKAYCYMVVSNNKVFPKELNEIILGYLDLNDDDLDIYLFELKSKINRKSSFDYEDCYYDNLAELFMPFYKKSLEEVKDMVVNNKINRESSSDCEDCYYDNLAELFLPFYNKSFTEVREMVVNNKIDDNLFKKINYQKIYQLYLPIFVSSVLEDFRIIFSKKLKPKYNKKSMPDNVIDEIISFLK